jgi:hypothetical protein
MADTTFVDSQTPVVAAWLNDVNDFVYGGTGGGYYQEGKLTLTSGQTSVTVPFTYSVGTNRLKVYINGIKQYIGTAYTETSPTTILLSEAVPGVGAVIEFTT